MEIILAMASPQFIFSNLTVKLVRASASTYKIMTGAAKYLVLESSKTTN